MSLIEAWTSDLNRVLATEELLVQTVRVGVFYTAAQITSGHVGVAFTPRELSDTVCCPKTAASAPPAGRMSGCPAWELAGFAMSASPLKRAVGVAVLNALSALALERHGVPGGELVAGLDALAAAEVVADDHVAMVGAFIPFIKALKGQVRSLHIIDKHPEALKADETSFWVAPGAVGATLAKATVLIISGSALVEGNIDELRSAARGARRIILAGPTASPWPPPFFAAGIDVLGGIRVRDGASLLEIVSEGGSGYLFEGAADKISVISARCAAGHRAVCS
ncbi:MAG: Rossmann-like domain-containing protein [Terriglobales bacterium]